MITENSDHKPCAFTGIFYGVINRSDECGKWLVSIFNLPEATAPLLVDVEDVGEEIVDHSHRVEGQLVQCEVRCRAGEHMVSRIKPYRPGHWPPEAVPAVFIRYDPTADNGAVTLLFTREHCWIFGAGLPYDRGQLVQMVGIDKLPVGVVLEKSSGLMVVESIHGFIPAAVQSACA